MKTSIYLWLTLLFCFGCQQQKTESFIPGMYVNHSEGMYSLADDTLVIRLVQGKNYQMLRRTGFNRVVERKLGVREHETETWSGLYDAEAGVINESRHSKVLSFLPDSGMLRVNNQVYKKIK